MKEIAISKFKATCLAVLEEVRRTGVPVRVTRFGKPVADIGPPAQAKKDASWLGSMAGTAEIVGDYESPIYSPEELDEIEAEWLANWDTIEAKGQEIAARNRRLAARRGKRKKRASA